MAVTPDKPAPYAGTGAIMDLVTRYRARGLPTPVTAEVLARAGISDSLNSRTLYAMQVLDLIDDSGQPTPTFEAIRKAPEAEFKTRLVEWLNGAYADALKFVDPATADETAVRDAFRNYHPVGQQPRMVSLFMGLYAAAGVGPERTIQQPRPQIRVSPRTVTPRSGMVSKSGAGSRTASHTNQNTPAGLPPAITGLLASLPTESGWWTQEARDKFYTTFGTILDFCFSTVAPNSPSDEEEGDA